MRLVQPQTMYTRYCNTPSAKVAICPNVGWMRDFADGQTMLSPTFAGKNILPQGNSNWPQLNDKAINDEIDKAEIAPADQRAAAWGQIDKDITAQAPGIPWLWDKTPLIESKNVNGVVAENNSQWDLSWTSSSSSFRGLTRELAAPLRAGPSCLTGAYLHLRIP